MSHHAIFYTAALYPHEHGTPWLDSSLMNVLAWTALPCVDVFLMMAGLFSARGCEKIAKDVTRPFDDVSRWDRFLVPRVVPRWRKFAPMHVVVVLCAYALGDGRFFPEGGVDWWRVASTFGWKNYRHDGFKGWFDLATTPLWSNFVDLHGTTLLVCLFSITGNLTFPVAAAWAVLSAVVRWNVIFNDFACLNVVCVDNDVVAILLTAPGDAGAPGLALGAAPYQLGTPGHCHPCPLDVGAFADNWSTNLYTPTHTRLAPIFVGAALAAALKNARPSPPIPPLRFAVLGLALLWAAESHALAPKLLTARVGAMLGSPQAVDALGSLAISTAWAVIVFAAVVPFDHWLRCDPIRRVLGASIWRFPASLTFGVYCLHWPVLMLALKCIKPLPSSDVWAFLVIFLPTMVGSVACAIAYNAVFLRAPTTTTRAHEA